jgi:hypothetical protein
MPVCARFSVEKEHSGIKGTGSGMKLNIDDIFQRRNVKIQ